MSNPQGDVKDWLLAMISRKKARTVGFGWNEIVEALRAIECNETADKICKQYKIPQPKSSAGIYTSIMLKFGGGNTVVVKISSCPS